MRRAWEVLELPPIVGRLMGFLCVCGPAQRVWPTPWRPAPGVKVTERRQRRDPAQLDRAGGRRREAVGPSPEPR